MVEFAGKGAKHLTFRCDRRQSHVPIRDTLQVLEIAESKGATVIGPNTPGLIVPDVIKVGIMPASPFSAGDIVVISKSGTLLYEISNSLTQAGFGQSITIGVGGDPVNGTRLVDAFDVAKDLPGLRGIVIVGEIGGDAEEIIAQRIIDTKFSKPVVAYIAVGLLQKRSGWNMLEQSYMVIMALLINGQNAWQSQRICKFGKFVCLLKISWRIF